MRRAATAALVLALVAVEPAEAKGRDTAKGTKAAKAGQRGKMGKQAKLGVGRSVRLVRPGVVRTLPGLLLTVPAPATVPGGGGLTGGAPVPVPAPAPARAPAPAARPAPVASEPPAKAPAPALPRFVSVRSSDSDPEKLAFVLSRPLVGAGLVSLELDNSRAEDPHDLSIVRADGTAPARTLTSAESREVSFADAQLTAGAYKLFCAIPGHEQLGMKATLRVE